MWPSTLHLWRLSQQWQPFLGAFIRGSARASFTSPRKSQSWRSLRAAWWLRSHTRLWWRAFHTSFHFVYFPFNEASSSTAYPLLSATAQSPTRPRLAKIKSSCPNWSQKFLSLFFHYYMSSVNGFIFWEVFGYVDFFFFKLRFELGVNNQDCNCEKPQLGRKVLRMGCYMLLESKWKLVKRWNIDKVSMNAKYVAKEKKKRRKKNNYFLSRTLPLMHFLSRPNLPLLIEKLVNENAFA